MMRMMTANMPTAANIESIVHLMISAFASAKSTLVANCAALTQS